MNDETYPKPTRELAQKRRSLGPNIDSAFQAFSQAVFATVRFPIRPND